MPVPQSVPLSLKENHTDLGSTPNSCYLLATNFEELTFPAPSPVKQGYYHPHLQKD